MAALADRSPEVRLLAALYFMRLAEADPAGAVPALAKLLDSPDYDLRQAAVGTLGTLGTNAGPAVNALVHSLQHDQIMFVRETAARSLAQLGPLAGSAQPALRVGLADPASGVRLWSAVALWQIARDPAGIPEMVSVLENTTDRTLCRTILPVLAQAGPLAEAAVPVLQSRMVEYGRVWRSNAHEKSLLILAKEALARIDPAAGIPTSEVAVKVPR
jgi:HEAT repeat protein